MSFRELARLDHRSDPGWIALQIGVRHARQATPDDWFASAIVWVCGDHPEPVILSGYGRSKRAALWELDTRIGALEHQQLLHLPNGTACA
jgi:hypothetical protein